MTRQKVIVITLLAVLVALGSASLFAQNGSSQPTALTLRLTPDFGCPGTVVLAGINLDTNPGSVTGSKIKLTSYPDGLISLPTENFFTVGDSVCAGDYVVTAELDAVSVSTHFTVGGEGCPNLAPCRPVGGVVMSTNTLAIAAPYLALAGLAAVVSTVILVKRRRD